MDTDFSAQEQADLAKPKDRPGDQPAPRTGYGPSMHDIVCEDIKARFILDPVLAGVVLDMQRRKDFGYQRYHKYLQAGNGRDALRDGYEEGLDLLVYVEQAKQETGPAELETRARLDTVYNLTIHNLTVLKALMLERDGG